MKTHKKPTYKKEVENIRTTSKSIHEVISRLQALWLIFDIKVTFTLYPSTFNNLVSNTHNSPAGYPQNWERKSHLPGGYPGWDGRWEGTIEHLKKDTEMDIYDLEIGMRGLIGIPWLHTGTGGKNGTTFRYSGMLFLYDFPLMHKEFKENGKEFKQLTIEFDKSVENYRRLFQGNCESYIKEQPEILQIKNILEELADLRVKVTNTYKEVEKHYTTKFIETYDVKLPTPDSIFIKDNEYQKAATSSQAPTLKPLPDLKKLVDRITELSTKAKLYAEQYPETLI